MHHCEMGSHSWAVFRFRPVEEFHQDAEEALDHLDLMRALECQNAPDACEASARSVFSPFHQRFQKASAADVQVCHESKPAAAVAAEHWHSDDSATRGSRWWSFASDW